MTSEQREKRTTLFIIEITAFLKLTKALATSMAIWILFFHGRRCLLGAAKSQMLFSMQFKK